MVDRNDYINFWLNDNSFVDKIESNSRDISKQPSLPHEWGFFVSPNNAINVHQ